MSKQRVLITGGAGFIGSHTADLLLKNDYRVRIFDNLSHSRHGGKWPKYLSNQTEKTQGDIRRALKLRSNLNNHTLKIETDILLREVLESELNLLKERGMIINE